MIDDTLDVEWLELIVKGKNLGLSVNEMRDFLHFAKKHGNLETMDLLALYFKETNQIALKVYKVEISQ